MKLSQILGLDLREEGNEEVLKEALYKLPFFSNEIDITTAQIEEAIKKMQRKYPIRLAYISVSTGENDEEPAWYYSCMVKRIDNHQHVKTVWGVTIYEALAKVALLMFGYIKTTLQKEGYK